MPDEVEKLKILACPPNYGGCAQYRIIVPMTKLQELYPDKVEVRYCDDPLGAEHMRDNPGEQFGFDEMKWADVILTCNIHKYGGDYTVGIARMAQQLGKFMHFDTDDLLTDLYPGHRHYDAYQTQQLGDYCKAMYALSDLVSVTQVKFADRVSQFCQNGVLAVIKNSIDFNLECWNAPKVPAGNRVTRIGWVGGIHHEEDVKEFKGVMMNLSQKVGKENIFWKLHGKPPIDPSNVDNDWQQSVWDNYQKWLTYGAKKTNVFIGNALPIDKYGLFYRDMDVSIAPLQMNAFNDSKSEVKLMECGRYGIPLVASDVGCYSEIIENGKTGFLIGKENRTTEWVKRLAYLHKNPEKRIEMGQNLKKVVDQYFDINKHVGERLELYTNVIKMKKDYLDGLKLKDRETSEVD